MSHLGGSVGEGFIWRVEPTGGRIHSFFHSFRSVFRSTTLKTKFSNLVFARINLQTSIFFFLNDNNSSHY